MPRMPNNSKAPREMHGGITTPAGKGSHRGRRADDGTYSYRSPQTTRRARLFHSFPACVPKRTPRVLLPFTPVENAGSVVGVRSAVPPWHSLGQLGSSCGMAGRRRGTSINLGKVLFLPSRRPARKWHHLGIAELHAQSTWCPAFTTITSELHAQPANRLAGLGAG